MKSRIEYIDVLKGIGIILVFMGHTAWGRPHLSKAIFIFHMPLFFFASGLLFRELRGISNLTNKLCRGLVFPYMFFCLLTIFSLGLSSRSSSVIWELCDRPHLVNMLVYGEQVPNRSLWFFFALMGAFLIVNMSYRFWSKGVMQKTMMACLLVVLAIAINGFGFGLSKGWLPFHMETIPLAALFVILGAIFSDWVKKLFCGEKSGTRSVAPLMIFAGGGGALAVSFAGGVVDMHFGRMDLVCYFGAVSGIALCLGLVYYVIRLIPLKLALMYIGRNSLYFFCLEGIVVFTLLPRLHYFGISSVSGMTAVLCKLVLVAALLFPTRFLYESLFERSLTLIRRLKR